MKNLDEMIMLLEAETTQERNIDKLDLKRLDAIVKGAKQRSSKEIKAREAANGDFGSKTTAIKNCKVKVFNELVEFLNYCSGIGLNGDKSINRAVNLEKFKYEYTENGKEKIRDAYKNDYWPTETEFNKVKANVMKEAEQLKRYEDVLDAAKDQKIGENILKKVGRIYYSQLDFNEPEKDMYGKMRLNADIFDDLYPVLGTLRKTNVPENLVRKISDQFGEMDDHGYQKLKNVIGKNIVKDNISQRTENAKGRFKRMKDAIYSDNEKEYDVTRKKEQGIDNITTAAKERNEIAAKAKNAEGEEKEKLMKQSRKEYDASRYAAKNLINTKTPEDFLKENGIDKLTNKKAIAILDKWIKENAPKDDKHKIKVYGSINGRSEQGLLAFIPGETSAYGDKAVKLDGDNGFRLVKTFFTKLTDEQKEYVADNRKNSAWKAKVNKVLIKSGVYTESLNNIVENIFLEDFDKNYTLLSTSDKGTVFYNEVGEEIEKPKFFNKSKAILLSKKLSTKDKKITPMVFWNK